MLNYKSMTFSFSVAREQAFFEQLVRELEKAANPWFRHKKLCLITA